MIFQDLNVSICNFSLNDELINSQNTYKNRQGCIVKLIIDDQHGFGEASPLPFYSREKFSEIIWALEEIKLSLNKDTNYTKDEFLNMFNLYAKNIPSLHFALDIALFDVLSKNQGIPLSKYLNNNALDSISFSCLCNYGNINKGQPIKIKLGIKDLDSELIDFYKFSKSYDKSQKYRIDANRAFSVKETLYLFDKLNGYNIEYIEEPLKRINFNNLEKIKKNPNIKIAIDETMFECNWKAFINTGFIDFVVLKAPLWGGVNDLFELVKFLNNNCIKIIFSSSLQTKIGNLASIHIAAAMECSGAHGLNIYNFFNYDEHSMPYMKNDISVCLKRVSGLGVMPDD